jgi:DNA-binding Xre family transcriptional regulator
MKTPDERIFDLIDLLKFEKKISSTKGFCQEIGILEQTVSKIKTGKNHFTVQHIEMICKKYKVNANWIFGIQKNIYNIPQTKQIKELS